MCVAQHCTSLLQGATHFFSWRPPAPLQPTCLPIHPLTQLLTRPPPMPQVVAALQTIGLVDSSLTINEDPRYTKLPWRQQLAQVRGGSVRQ